jgi:hypothetical protein
MNEIDHFKFFVLYSDNMTPDMNHLHVKRIYLVNFSYIVIEDADKSSTSARHNSKSTGGVGVLVTNKFERSLPAPMLGPMSQ